MLASALGRDRGGVRGTTAARTAAAEDRQAPRGAPRSSTALRWLTAPRHRAEHEGSS